MQTCSTQVVLPLTSDQLMAIHSWFSGAFYSQRTFSSTLFVICSPQDPLILDASTVYILRGQDVNGFAKFGDPLF